MRDDLRVELVIDALQMAVTRRKPDVGLVQHFDRGSLLGFKRSSQHRFLEQSVAVRRELLPWFSSRGSCTVCC